MKKYKSVLSYPNMHSLNNNNQNALKRIKKMLTQFRDNKILFFCIGSILRGDDGVGEYIYTKLQEKENILKINTGNAPVNYIGKVEKISPDIVILVDCINKNAAPGDLIFEEFSQLYTSPIDTHSGLIGEFIKLIKKGPKWYLIGIQPLDFTGVNKISPVVNKTADALIEVINDLT